MGATRCLVVSTAKLEGLVQHAKALLEPHVGGELFLLLVDPHDPVSVALVLAAGILRVSCVLLHVGRSHKTQHVADQTGCSLILEHDPAEQRLVERRNTGPPVADPPWRKATQHHSSGDDGVVCILTSGSTGEAKIVVYTWEGVWLQARETATRILFPSSWFVVTTPVSHAYNMNGLFAAYVGGATLCIAFSAAAVAECAAQAPRPSPAHTNVLFGCPPLFADLLALNTSQLESWPFDQTYCAGSTLPLHVWTQFRDRYGCCIRQNYGTSETGNIALYARDENYVDMQKEGYKGVAWGEVRLLPPATGATVRPGEEEVCVRVPWMSLGYVQDACFLPHASWYRTGDAGRVDDSVDPPHVFVHRRLRPPFRLHEGTREVAVQACVVGCKRRGWFGSCEPEDVEQLFARHIEGAQGVAATQDESEGEGIVAHVALGSQCAGDDASQDQQARALLQRLHASLGKDWAHVTPRRVVVYAALPSSPAGKLLYGDLKKKRTPLE